MYVIVMNPWLTIRRRKGECSATRTCTMHLKISRGLMRHRSPVDMTRVTIQRITPHVRCCSRRDGMVRAAACCLQLVPQPNKPSGRVIANDCVSQRRAACRTPGHDGARECLTSLSSVQMLCCIIHNRRAHLDSATHGCSCIDPPVRFRNTACVA